MRIPVSLVEHHEKDIFFLVDIDYTYIQAVIPRVRWLRPLGYELDVDQASTTIIAILAKETDKAAKHFGTYDVVKSRVVIDLKIATTVKKKDKLIKKLKKRFGADIGEARTAEEEEAGDEEEDDSEKEEEEPEQGPLQLTQGLGEDQEEGAEEEEAKEAPIRTKVTKRKAKAPPAPQPKAKKVSKPAPKKPTTRATTRATTQKEKEEAAKKKKTTKKTKEELRKRRKYVAQPDSNKEKIESDDNS